MINPVKNSDGMWEVPDAKEFLCNCRWDGQKFIVPHVISKFAVFSDERQAKKEALMLDLLIFSARTIENMEADET